MSLSPELYGALRRWAARYARRADEADELVHDVLLDALRRGIVDWESPSRRAWLRAALRRHAAFTARSAGRRRRREQQAAEATERVAPAVEPRETHEGSSGAWRALPPSLRVVAVLLASGLSREEVRCVLGLGEAALRQRLHQLRKRWPLPELALPATDDTGLAWGRLRKALRDALRRDSRVVLGAHDPDGHLLLFTLPVREAENSASPCSRSRASRQQASATCSDVGAPQKENPC